MHLQKLLLGAQQVFSSWHSSGAGGSSLATSNTSIASNHLSDMGIGEAKLLFGGSLAWNTTGKVHWMSVDDRVRGGSSWSVLEPRQVGGHHDAVFRGNLDTSTLGGAGFASVSSVFDDQDESLDLSGFDGLLLNVTYADDKKYTFTIKDSPPSKRPDGRMRSAVSYEYQFQASSNSSVSPYQSIRIPWTALTATYRGREVDAPPVLTRRIFRLGMMARSFFDQQQGPFSLSLHSISAYKQVVDANETPGQAESN